jgi:hypothetical protein
MKIVTALFAFLCCSFVVAACGPSLPDAGAPPSTATAPDGGACLAAGDGWAAFPPGNPHLACCAGLTPVEGYEATEREQHHQCVPSKGGRTNCVKCGDGVCGPGENFCNCPADCGK